MREPIKDSKGGCIQVHRPVPTFGILEIQDSALNIDVLPPHCQNFILATSGEQQEPDPRDGLPPHLGYNNCVAVRILDSAPTLLTGNAEHFAQSYDLRGEAPNPILGAFVVLSGRKLVGLEFLPSRSIHEWAMTQEDLAADPLIQRETKRIEKALARVR